jgi:cytochrome c553
MCSRDKPSIARRRIRLLIRLVTWLLAFSVFTGSAYTAVDMPSRGNFRKPDEPTIPAPCLTCHGADIIRTQRLSEAAWLREVEKMIGWGAAVDARDKEDLVKSLSGRFGPGGVISTAAKTATPLDPLVSQCLTCHDLQLIEQQRLTVAGWQREIDKMIGWGAVLSPSEKLRLGEYLAGRFAPDR